jgi:hypothetical protein
MSITDELREYANTRISPNKGMLTAIADRIDAEHERLMQEQPFTIDMVPMTDERMAEHGWIRLPKDADGEYIHVGDEVYQVEGGWVYTVESIRFYPDNTTVTFSCKHGFGCDSAHNVRHYHAPTVEDVLREFAERYLDYEGIPSAGRRGVGEALMDEYASKLRLAEGEDA